MDKGKLNEWMVKKEKWTLNEIQTQLYTTCSSTFI